MVSYNIEYYKYILTKIKKSKENDEGFMVYT